MMKPSEPRPALRLALAAALVSAAAMAALAGGCKSGDKLVNKCTTDADCGDPALWRCNVQNGECLCRSDQACPVGESCNSEGYCQKHFGCYESRDCPAGYFCDPNSNTCIPVGRCASDLDCPVDKGELCDPTTKLCKPGCRSAGDCNAGNREVCICTTKDENGQPQEAPCVCDALTDSGRLHCPIGRCVAQTCLDNSYCGYGQVCREPPEGGLKQCIDDYDAQARPYCDGCTAAPGQQECGTGPNFCLYSTYTGSNYCGVDCSQGQDCPNGYDCKDVIVVWTRTKCTDESQCASPDHRSNIVCTNDTECPNNGVCGKDPGQQTGFCHGLCTKHEGANESFCSCIVDEDCAQETCDLVSGSCSISRRPCTRTEDCRSIHCVDFGDKGGCLIGQNCKPLEGLTCANLKGQ